MQARLGSDVGAHLGAVRVHDDVHADRLARDLGAQAFTAGSDIYFRQGAYAPGSRRGVEVLAHEAVHTVQQSRGGVSGTAQPDGVQLSDPADPHEREATRIATRLAARSGQEPALAVSATSSTNGELTIQRWVNEDFGDSRPQGVPTEKQEKTARRFASKVSGFAEQAREELMTGDFAGWGRARAYDAKGARYLAFVQLLGRKNRMAVTHAGNVIEDRVYQLMAENAMGLKWDSQLTFNTSRPDVAAQLDDEYAIVDITSDVGHVVSKVGLWSAPEIVYIAEAVFKSVTAALLENARDTILGETAMTSDELAQMEAKVEAKAVRAAQKRRDVAADLREKLDEEYGGSVEAYADAEFDSDLKAASDFLRKNGVVRKGMTKGPRRQSGVFDFEAKAEKRRQAYALKAAKRRSESRSKKKTKKRRRSSSSSRSPSPRRRSSYSSDSD